MYYFLFLLINACANAFPLLVQFISVLKWKKIMLWFFFMWLSLKINSFNILIWLIFLEFENYVFFSFVIFCSPLFGFSLFRTYFFTSSFYSNFHPQSLFIFKIKLHQGKINELRNILDRTKSSLSKLIFYSFFVWSNIFFSCVWLF